MNKNSILTKLQKRFLELFFKSYLGFNFFLTGGTALSAFYLKHRLSEDLDLFTLEQNLSFDKINAEVRKIAAYLKLKADHRVSSPTFSQFFLEIKAKEVLKIDLVREVPIHFGRIKKKGVIKVDSLENIAVNKILAIYGRLDPKDYLDFYFLIKEKKVEFEDIFKKAQKKDLGLNELYLGNMMAEVGKLKYFPKTLKPFSRKRLVELYLDLSNKLFKKIKPKT